MTTGSVTVAVDERAELAARVATVEAGWVPMADKPEETPLSTVRALWLAAAGIACSARSAMDRPLPSLDDAQRRALDELLERRLQGVPLAHLTGRQRFMGLELVAGPAALIPRVETELLAQQAIDLARQRVATSGEALVVDVGTGSGNLALAIAKHVPECAVVGTDIAPDAVALARENATRAGLENRVRFHEGDLFEPLERAGLVGAVDVLVCNPPYISSTKVDAMAGEMALEPRAAFDGGPLGISILFRLIAGAPRYLKPGGWLCFEVGVARGSPMEARLERSNAYADIRAVVDATGDVRVLVARARDGGQG